MIGMPCSVFTHKNYGSYNSRFFSGGFSDSQIFCSGFLDNAEGIQLGG